MAACLADAFFEDPVWGLWTFPDESTRADRLRGFMEFWARAGVRVEWLRATANCESIAAWVPPGVPDLTPDEEDELFHALLPRLLGDRVAEVEDLFREFEERHPDDEDHFYLGWWATRRDFAGRGFGGALIRESLELIDVAHKPAYLESTNPANLARYEALGFERRDEFGPPGGPLITTMWRPAR